MPADYYGLETAFLNQHASGNNIQVVAAPTNGHIVVDFLIVSNTAASTIKIQSNSGGGTEDVDYFTINLTSSSLAFNASNLKMKLGNAHSLDVSVSTGTFSILVGYHIEQ